MLTQEECDALVAAALDVRRQAYAPYSRFLVGAAIMDMQGVVHVGCNVENASFGLTMCAERVAIGSAVARGQKQWKGIVIASAGAVTPCGACRQVLHEFGSDLEVVLVDADSELVAKRWTIAELLPGAFQFKK